MQIELSSFKERNINFLPSFLFYIIGLAFYLSSLLPFMKSLIPKNIPIQVVEQVKHLDYIIAIAALFLLMFGVIFEGFVLFLIINFLGAQIKIKTFYSLFMFSNIPVAIKFFLISFKNIFAEHPNTSLFFTSNHLIFSIFDLFNIAYLFLLFILLKWRTNLNYLTISVFIFTAFLYRMFF
ncbi:hypothetical protein HCC49_17590 [Bacillus velezensis]|nr:hypothetical protein [Bacillus velezensis]QIW85579.1 hypothetical protein HCC49_17590 [Bacillus velezensis]